MSDGDIARGHIDPGLFRGLTQARLSRRGMLRGAGALGGAAALSALLTACSIPGTNQSGTADERINWTEWWAGKKQLGTLNFANWPLYIDQDDNGNSESLKRFTAATGIHVNYKEVINDVQTFYAKVAPQLRAGQSTGYDLAVLTNGWQLTEMIDNGWLAQLDHSQMPNFIANAGRDTLFPAFDPGSLHTAVWQSGFTGLAYNEKLTGGPIESFADLLKPEFAGKIGMLDDNVEYGSAALLAIGVEPTKSTHADWKKAVDWLNKLQPSVTKYYDQGYTDALQNGDIWICQAYSGDVFQLNAGGHPEIKYVVPKEGQVVWHDNMIIPITADHPVDALKMIDFVYRPEIAALIADYVNYVSPVPAAQQIIRDQLGDPAVADSPLVFPTAEMLAKTHDYYVFKDYADFTAWNDIFNPISQA
ncbi:MAG: spermidine/putrescine ABC transporter substrate-binding protein [Microbacteriaceae bacterium]|nr:spermidine/putrescine ABC transporter substrate-binding protein [Microbacteriaceae bacterium]MCL2794249.1 spermidine/putrescine ABC transporter substrate-binding protein [Microbacteriaceae bacterium]